MMRLVWSTLSSGWTMAMPRRASLMTSAGSLMSFFTGRLLRLQRWSGRWGGMLRLDGCRIGAGAGDRDVGECGERAGQELGGQIDGQLTPRDGPAGDLLEE